MGQLATFMPALFGGLSSESTPLVERTLRVYAQVGGVAEFRHKLP